MLTTLSERVHAAFEREPIAFCLAALLLLTGAGVGGMSARQIFTAAPSASGAVNLASTTGTEGVAASMMRSDATLGVQGVLPVANGGTGTTTGPVLLQASTPGSVQTGNWNVSGQGALDTIKARIHYNTDASGYIGLWDSTNKIFGAFNPGAPPGSSALWQWDTGTTAPGFANDNGAVYTWKVNGTTAIAINRNGKVFLGGAGASQGISGGGNDVLWVNVNGNSASPTMVLDTNGVACSPANKKLLVINGNGTEKFSVQCDGVLNTATGGFLTKVGSATATLAALSVSGSACAYDSTTGTVTGAVTSDHCSPVYVTGLGAGVALSMSCEVTASNTVSWRFCNHTSSSVGIPVAQSYLAYVTR